ncbi:hypothetical protein Hanom_Chr12g01107951 [Helianthus anomalus]
MVVSFVRKHSFTHFLSSFLSFSPSRLVPFSYFWLFSFSMGARKDLAKSFSRLTQEEVEIFCVEWGIGLRFKPVAPGCDVSID